MELLKLLASVRTDFFTNFFSVITWAGHETIPVIIVFFFLWCYDKKKGYFIAFGYFFSGLICQALKVIFRVPRPWIKDSSFKPVESAIGGASGYSFPSGHTQSITSLAISISLTMKKKLFWIVSFVIAALVIFSRLYLGVHTPLDVSVSFLVTITVCIISYFAISKIYDTNKYDLLVSIIMIVLAFGTAALSFILYKVNYIDFDNSIDAIKAGGAGLGFAIGFYVERKYINYKTTTKNIGMQILKFVIGVAFCLGMKELLKYIFSLIFTSDFTISMGNFIRYFVLVSLACMVYPLIIKKFFQYDKETENTKEKENV